MPPRTRLHSTSALASAPASWASSVALTLGELTHRPFQQRRRLADRQEGTPPGDLLIGQRRARGELRLAERRRDLGCFAQSLQRRG